jgi:hypothetical protein
MDVVSSVGGSVVVVDVLVVLVVEVDVDVLVVGVPVAATTVVSWISESPTSSDTEHDAATMKNAHELKMPSTLFGHSRTAFTPARLRSHL